ncbi:MAG: hypothetical protein DLM50_00015 [Candidatus Meridianibacter frigidus]|nr:MAG: hypothetical protein DLM50_00015 [Candidatus Eremiobacteraeota bacterium]
MPRRSKFAEAAERWMKKQARGKTVSSDELWNGLVQSDPDLCAASANRKTPRTTCMRDLRKDDRFEVGERKIRLRE